MNIGAYEHIWIGYTLKDKEEYYRYFELDCKHDLDDENYRICDFCKDIGWQWYDEDFIIMPEPNKHTKIENLIKEITLDTDTINSIIIKCKELGINRVNTIFSYSVPDEYNGKIEEISRPIKDNYNDLKYIGLYETGY